MNGLRFDQISGWCIGLAAAVCLNGCGSGGGGGGGGGGGSNNRVRVAFTGNPNGMFAVAMDEQGNEFTFFADRDANGNMRITEANARTGNNVITKASLDNQGRPVNLRGSDGTAANVLFKSDNTVKVAVVNGGTNEGMVVDNLNVDAANRSRRKSATNFQSITDPNLRTLDSGLGTYDGVIRDLFSRERNPDSPLIGTSLEQPCLQIADIVAVLNLAVIVDASQLAQDVTLDELPALLAQLSGTWELCARTGVPSLQDYGVESRLVFGTKTEPHLLTTEFDRQNLFEISAGLTLNYLSGMTVPRDYGNGLELEVTPVYSATSLDGGGRIVVERRFRINLTPTVPGAQLPADFNGPVEINAVLANGEITDGVLSFDLRLINLTADNTDVTPEPTALFYVREGAPPCSSPSPPPINVQVTCPPSVLDAFDEAPVSVTIPASFVDPEVAWYVISGDAFFDDDTAADTTLVVISGPQVQIGVVVSDANGNSAAAECQPVTVIETEPPPPPPTGSGVRITLTWNSFDDLDLIVTDPDNEEISYQNPLSFSGGAHSGDSQDGGPETVIWPDSSAPPGTYLIGVESFTDSTVEYTVELEIDGAVQTLTGTVDGFDLVTAATFEVAGSDNIPPPPGGLVPVTVNLTWDTDDDLDLVVVDPFGAEISYTDPVSSSGGMHFGDVTDGFGPETVEWASGAPAGDYQVIIQSINAIAPVHYVLIANVGGVLNRADGTVFPDVDENLTFTVP